jgi:hypothetical protein
MRYLYTADDQLFAYAPGRRDFFLSGDDHLWAHESHGWLIAAKSGEALAHRTGDVYYGAVDGKPLYRLATDLEAAADGETGAAPANGAASEDDAGRGNADASTVQPRRAPQRVARARR